MFEGLCAVGTIAVMVMLVKLSRQITNQVNDACNDEDS